MNQRLLIPTATGIEAVVKRQLYSMGYTDTYADNGRIVVDNCSWSDVAKLNLWLRSGERVLISLASFTATTFDMLYEGVSSIDWSQWLSRYSNVYVITKTVKSTLFAHHSIQSIAKKAIVNSMGGTLDESGATVTVEIAIHNDIVTVNLDSSGTGLHKRGYRTMPYTAPLKETTASALLDLSVWHGDKTLADIFCGSGTIPIEAALKACNMAVGMNRTFDFAQWIHLGTAKYLAEAKAEARDVVKVRQLDIIGSDLSPQALEIAQFHANQAGVGNCIRWQQGNATNFSNSGSYGVILSNPPYGERLLDETEVEWLMHDLRPMYDKLDNWSMYLLTSLQTVELCMDKRADKKRKLYNAGLLCSFYSFLGDKPPKENIDKNSQN